MDRLGVFFLVCVSCLMVPFGSYAQRTVTVEGHVYCEDKSHALRNVQVDSGRRPGAGRERDNRSTTENSASMD